MRHEISLQNPRSPDKYWGERIEGWPQELKFTNESTIYERVRILEIVQEDVLLTLSLRPGEYVDIGDDIRLIFTGGTRNSIHVLVDAPRELAITRSEAPAEMKEPKRRRAGSKVERRDASEDNTGSLIQRIEDIFEGY
jgi:carbon storage regulator